MRKPAKATEKKKQWSTLYEYDFLFPYSPNSVSAVYLTIRKGHSLRLKKKRHVMSRATPEILDDF